MFRILDRFLLFLISLFTLLASIVGLAAGFGAGWLSDSNAQDWLTSVQNAPSIQITVIVAAVVLLLISVRLLYVSFRRAKGKAPSINQRSDYGDIRISLDTVENLALKAAGRVRGVKDLKARVSVGSAGIEIGIRTVVDGEAAIPLLTEEVQRAVKGHVEDVTGIPVSDVSVFVANIAQTQTFKSRVE